MLAARPVGGLFSLSDEILACGTITSKGHGTEGVLLQTAKEVDRKLNSIEDRLIDDPAHLCRDGLYFDIKQLLSGFNELGTEAKLKLVGIIQTAFGKLCQGLRGALGRAPFHADNWKLPAEMYAATIWNAILAAENVDKTASSTGKGASAKGRQTVFDWGQIRTALLESIKLFTALPLGRVFDSPAERESATSCFVKAAHRILEAPENAKSLVTKRLALEVLVECARAQGYTLGLQTIISQDLIYFEHLAEPIAELLQLLYAANDSGCELVCGEILKTLGVHRFSSQDSTTSTRIAAVFLAKFAATCPRETLKSLSLFIDQIDSEAYSIRMAMIEVIGSLIFHLMSQEDRSDSIKAQTKSLFGALEERFRDVNSFVRSKTIQVCCDLAKTSSIPINKRPRLLQLAADRIMDKSSIVRRKAIQLMGDFLRTHPFCVDGGELNLEFFQSRLGELNRYLNEIAPLEVKERAGSISRDNDDDAMDVSSSDREQDAAELSLSAQANPAQIGSLLVQKQYYTDAIKFVSLINSVIPTICLLLSSTTKSEVFEVMEFLVEAHIYRLEKSQEGIRKMLHLIWEKELSSEDGTKTSIREHLIQNYKKIYLFADDRLPAKERAQAIAKNLVGLVDGITVAELASLSELLGAFMKKNLINDGVIQQVFSIFVAADADRRNRRAALIILALLARSRRDIIEKRLEAIVKIGLGPLGQADPLIAQYTLEAIQCLAGASPAESLALRLPHDNVLFERISSFVMARCSSPRWFPVLSQAVKTIFLLADKPSSLVSTLLGALTEEVFANAEAMADSASALTQCSRNKLCRLLLAIGQVASCLSTHLDLVERHGKDTAQKLDASARKGADADLAKVSASAEDDFSELVKGVREHEVLFDSQSILATLAPLVTFVCSNNVLFADVSLQRVATLALVRLMTVSSAFCEQSLQLYLTIMEHSEDAVIRSNMAIAFGDLAQIFNRLVDQNMDYLFNRLSDRDLTVRRNTLMVLTHLTLTGMIKVKGQIGEIAKCLIDQDDRIRNLAKIFFSEMANRDSGTVGSNGIYNHIPDILSHLSVSEAMVSEDDFQAIMKFIFDFIKKERQMENLIEKLCLRFRQSDSLRHGRDLAFCLGLINFSGDRALKKLVEGFPLYQDKLVDERIMRAFVEIVNRSRKFCKAELKLVLDEFETRLVKAANGNLERTGEASIASFAALSQSVTKKKAAAAASKTRKPAKPRRKQQEDEYEDDDEDMDMDMDDYDNDTDSDDRAGLETQTSKAPTRASSRKASAAVKFYEEDESELARNPSRHHGSQSRTSGKASVSRSQRPIVQSDDGDEDDIF